MEQTKKAAYYAPKLVELGTFEQMTLGSKPGTNTDKKGSLPKPTS